MNLVPPKQVGESCKSTYCKMQNKKCHIFSKEQRENIMKEYYALATLELQREFICRHVVIKESKVKREGSRRQTTYRYFLTSNSIMTPVCKKFFLNTLAISEMMRKSMSKLSPNGTVEKEKKRWKKRICEDTR